MIKCQDAAPFIVEVPQGLDAVTAFRQLATRRHTIFFDSALRDANVGRYSFVACDPFDFVSLPNESPCVGQAAGIVDDGLSRLQFAMQAFQSCLIEGLPPFQGGAAGLFGYELGRRLERVPASKHDEFRTPPMFVGLYDVVVAFDHAQDKGWVISHGFPEGNPAKRTDRAWQRGREVLNQLTAPSIPTLNQLNSETGRLAAARLAPQFPTGRNAKLTSNFSREEYLHTVERVVEYIHAGDIFQANLSQRLLAPAECHAVELYLRLRARNAAPFAAYFDLGNFQIASASPERFLRVINRQAEARPIKGTRSRMSVPEADLYSQDELQWSAKDRSENVMIVDLLRNDLSKFCQPDSVSVTQLCEVEVFQFVHHLVSAVVGRLRDDATPLDLVRGAFPGGSITGAPKIRAMEIIAELEPTARGPYCGCLGYLGFDGTLDTNILIRTITAGRGWWQAPVGGGIVAASRPADEYEETWHKATGLLKAFTP